MSPEKKARFTGLRRTKEITLPSVKDSSVVVYTSLIVSEQREMQAKWPRPNDLNEKEKTDMTVWMCIKAIKSWNLVDGNDQALPISEDVLNQLEINDILTIMEVVTGQVLLENGKPVTEEKKRMN